MRECVVKNEKYLGSGKAEVDGFRMGCVLGPEIRFRVCGSFCDARVIRMCVNSLRKYMIIIFLNRYDDLSSFIGTHKKRW